MINDNEMPVVEGTSWTGPPLHYLRHMLDILWDYHALRMSTSFYVMTLLRVIIIRSLYQFVVNQKYG